MSNTTEATETLDKAREKGDFQTAIVVGKDSNGKVAIFCGEAGKEAMIATLERARNALVKSLDG